MDALRQSIEKVLGPIPSNLADAQRGLQSSLRKKKVNPWDGLRTGIALGLWERIEEELSDKPEPSPLQLERYLKEMREADLNSVVRSFFHTGLRKLPPLPPGKQPKFSPDKVVKLRAEVEREVSRSGSPRKDVYKRIAKKHKVHWRTIQNHCGKKKSALDFSPNTNDFR